MKISRFRIKDAALSSARYLPWKSNSVRNASILAIGTALSQLIVIASSPIITRIYNPVEFGEFALFAAILSVTAAGAAFRYELAVMLPHKDYDSDHLVILSIFLSTIFSVAFVFAVLLIDTMGFLDSYVGIVWWHYLIPLGSFLGGSYAALNYWLNRRRQYTTIAGNRIAQRGLGSICQIGFGLLGWGLPGLIWATLLASAATTFSIAVRFLRNFQRAGNGFAFGSLQSVAWQYRNHPKYLLPAQWVGAAAQQVPTIVIATQYGLAIAGFFTLATRIVALPTQLVAQAVGDVYRERAATARRKRGNFRKEFCVVLIGQLSISILPFLAIIAFAPSAFAVVFGDEWLRAGEFAQILAVMTWFQFVFTPIDKGAVIVGANSYIFWWHWIRLGVYMLISILTIYLSISVEMFLWLYAISTALIYFSDVFFQYRFACRHSEIQPDFD